MIKVAVVSDTHGLLRPEVIPALEGCSQVLHIGDVGDQSILDALSSIGPVTVVRGNTDRGDFGAGLPLTAMIEIEGHLLYLIHILEDLDLDPKAAGVSVVLTGHTHRAKRMERDGVTFFNPGSCGARRFDLPVTVGTLELEKDQPPVAKVIDLGV